MAEGVAEGLAGVAAAAAAAFLGIMKYDVNA
jgi:hypothetical protein